jgi:phosphoglucomutase
MSVDKLAGKPVDPSMTENISRLVTEFFISKPDSSVPGQRVSFGTSGHRGTSKKCSFNERHIAAVTQAVCEYRSKNSIDGPLFLGMDTHALSEPARAVALEVLTANGVTVFVDERFAYTPTPVISRSIVKYNKNNRKTVADGIVITPSHNPPEDGGFKYNPPHGGPADTDTTRWIEDRANRIMSEENHSVRRIPYSRALKSENLKLYDFTGNYIDELGTVVNLEAVRSAGIKIGCDPLGGSGLEYWEPIAEHYGLDLTVVNPRLDPTFSFMTYDKDGKIRMDCSSPFAMASLIQLKDKYDIAIGNDPDFDRHGIVTSSGGLMNPNHYLSVAIWYLFQNRNKWRKDAIIGKTLVSSSMIDRVGKHLGRTVAEVPVGFKWFVTGLSDGSYGFGGEESAGASFLEMNGDVWTTDKDGFIMGLLAAEIMAETGHDPAEVYLELENMFGSPLYTRIDAPANVSQKEALKKLQPGDIKQTELAGDEIQSILTRAPANQAPIGGLKVSSEHGWFAARPSGTEEIYKIYAESFKGREHLELILSNARSIVEEAFR